MAFEQSEESGKLTQEVDEFFRATLEHNKHIGANLSVMLGSFMLPGMMGVKGGGGPPRYRPSMDFLRFVGKSRPKLVKPPAPKVGDIVKTPHGKVRYDGLGGGHAEMKIPDQHYWTFMEGPAYKGTFASKTSAMDDVAGAAGRIAKPFIKAAAEKAAAQAGKPAIRAEEASNVIPFSRATGQKKGYTRTEAEALSDFLKTPEAQVPSPGTQGKGLGYGAHRKSPDYSPREIVTPKDPAQYLTKKAFRHFNKLTPAQRRQGGFKEWEDLYELWEMRFNTGQKSGLPRDVYEMFSKLMKE